MATTRSADAVFGLCHKATVLGNKIAIHLLEYLGTVEKHSSQFDDLANEFMDTSRIMWSLEAGLAECARTNQRLPTEMISELDKKFRATHNDFQVLDQILGRFLDYEKKGAVGRLQKGWRSMFSPNDVQKMRENLEKTREALRMSALVFQWSLGDDKVDDSVGIGYTGLAAALERMAAKGKTAGSSSTSSAGGAPSSGVAREKAQEVVHLIHEIHPIMEDHHQHQQHPPTLPPITLSRGSGTDRSSSNPAREEASSPIFRNLHQEREREGSLSNYTIKTSSSHSGGARERRISMADGFERAIEHNSSSGGSGAHHGATAADHLAEDMEAFEPFKVVRFKADPASQPRWTPRNHSSNTGVGSGADAHAVRESLLSAVETRNAKLVEQLLDRGVSPNLGPHAHVLNQAVAHHDTETVRILLLFGADPNAPGSRSVTPLHVAVEESSLEAATMLLK